MVFRTDYDIIFRGKDRAECESFVRAVQVHIFKIGKDQDDEWPARFAAAGCFAGEALQWYVNLDPATQGSWKSLRHALLEKWPLDMPSNQVKKSESEESAPRSVPITCARAEGSPAITA